ncbi:homocitrate synthase, partial [Haloferax namakaokahaiae]
MSDPVLLDVTCREGEQRPGESYTTEQKIAAVEALDALGVEYVQVGFPIA